MPDYDPQRGRSRGRDDEGPAPVDALLGPDPTSPDEPGPEAPPPASTDEAGPKPHAARAPVKKTPAKKAAKKAAKSAAKKTAAKKTAAKKAPAKKATKAAKKAAEVPDGPAATEPVGPEPASRPEPVVPIAPATTEPTLADPGVTRAAAAVAAEVSVTGIVTPPTDGPASVGSGDPVGRPGQPGWSEPLLPTPSRSRRAPAALAVAVGATLLVVWALLRHRRRSSEDS